MCLARGSCGRNREIDGENSRRCGQISKSEGWDNYKLSANAKTFRYRKLSEAKV